MVLVAAAIVVYSTPSTPCRLVVEEDWLPRRSRGIILIGKVRLLAGEVRQIRLTARYYNKVGLVITGKKEDKETGGIVCIQLCVSFASRSHYDSYIEK